MKTNKLFFTICCLAIMAGCKKQLDEGITPPNQLNTSISVSNPKNPYSVTNMRKAFANLLITDVQLIRENKLNYTKGKVMFTDNNQVLSINKQLSTKQGAAIATNGINATHYYLKFMPRNKADYALLKRDSNLVIYPFPLDNENTTYRGNYRDPAITVDSIPTYQYAAIPISYVLPAVPYQKIEDLYLPDEQSKNSQVTVKGEGDSSFTVSVQQLVNQALCDGDDPDNPPTESKAATNNNILKANIDKPSVISLLPPEDEEPCDGTSGGGGGPYPPDDEYRNGENWRPNGRITLFDDSKNMTIGVEGIKVRARRWFTTYTGITDANGYYAVDGWYTRPANYWLDFERYDFAVIDFVHQSTIEVSGPKIEAAWNVDFSGYDKYCATIFRAAIHYYYKDIQGLRRPPQNGFLQRQLKITALPITSTESGSTVPYHTWFGINDLVTIRTLANSTEFTYGTTIHELFHAAHWDESNWSFAMSEPTVSESMAAGVEWVLTKMEYPYYKGMWSYSGGNYRNVVMDMIDDFDPNNTAPNFYVNYGFGSSFDQVEGYSIVQIQDAMINNANTWNEWKTNIKNNYNNGTENNLDALFDTWLNY